MVICSINDYGSYELSRSEFEVWTHQSLCLCILHISSYLVPEIFLRFPSILLLYGAQYSFRAKRCYRTKTYSIVRNVLCGLRCDIIIIRMRRVSLNIACLRWMRCLRWWMTHTTYVKKTHQQCVFNKVIVVQTESLLVSSVTMWWIKWDILPYEMQGLTHKEASFACCWL